MEYEYDVDDAGLEMVEIGSAQPFGLDGIAIYETTVYKGKNLRIVTSDCLETIDLEGRYI